MSGRQCWLHARRQMTHSRAACRAVVEYDGWLQVQAEAQKAAEQKREAEAAAQAAAAAAAAATGAPVAPQLNKTDVSHMTQPQTAAHVCCFTTKLRLLGYSAHNK